MKRLIISVVVIAVVAIVAASPRDPAPKSTQVWAEHPSTPVVPAKVEDYAGTAIELARRDVSAAMRDPSSAAFRDLSAVKTPSGRGVIVCGEVTGKNGFGGFTGFREFIWAPGSVILGENTKRAAFVKAWNGTCAKWQTIVSVKS